MKWLAPRRWTLWLEPGHASLWPQSTGNEGRTRLDCSPDERGLETLLPPCLAQVREKGGRTLDIVLGSRLSPCLHLDLGPEALPESIKNDWMQQQFDKAWPCEGGWTLQADRATNQGRLAIYGLSRSLHQLLAREARAAQLSVRSMQPALAWVWRHRLPAALAIRRARFPETSLEPFWVVVQETDRIVAAACKQDRVEALAILPVVAGSSRHADLRGMLTRWEARLGLVPLPGAIWFSPDLEVTAVDEGEGSAVISAPLFASSVSKRPTGAAESLAANGLQET
ncbi:hypothetical protein M8A51_18735 [Schlegelella sp. S2-27]|uniref:Uncharacterized protein n=1 Tax=Caldimonas mangrovi TaxID=2944811 RepID=A0ABT0YS52_9BURK|nr:hypothetical protein [Caldimonas mangrovi]MCM5681566.1 hypothetical protein [Caldimonas mangrovi]